MKKIYLIALISLLSVVSIQIVAQEVPPDKRSVWFTDVQKGFLVISGDISAIKGQKTLNISISKRIQKMGTKYQPDSVFIANRVKEFNDETNIGFFISKNDSLFYLPWGKMIEFLTIVQLK